MNSQLADPTSALHAPPALPRSWAPAPAGRGGPSQRARNATSWGITVTVVGFAMLATTAGVDVPGFPELGENPAAARPPGWPAPADDQSGDRILPVVNGPAGEGGFAFERTRSDGTPVTYDPCRPVHYVIDPQGAPAGGVRMVQDAVDQLSQATGLAFVYDGTTDEPFARDRTDVQEDRYGDRWVPVLVAWRTADDYPELAGYIAGVGGSTSVGRTGDGDHYVTGRLVLDRDTFRQIRDDRMGEKVGEAIVLHELGHVVGLAHVNDPRQIMFSESQLNVTAYAAGDLRGLALLGAGDCYPVD